MRRVADTCLWLGHVGDARNFRALFAADIQALVDLARSEPPLAVPREITYCRFPLVDGEGNPPALLRLAVATVTDLLRANVPTLVYCANGMSRSVVIVAAAISVTRGEPMARALERIAPTGPADVSPAFEVSVHRAMYPDALNDITFQPTDPREVR